MVRIRHVEKPPELVGAKALAGFSGRHGATNNVWAPEVFWDHVAKDFKVVWSSTLRSEYDDGDGSRDTHRGDHRMYFTATTDFESFSRPVPVCPDPGWSVIDAQVVWDVPNKRWVMPLKKELLPENGGKNIRLAFSSPDIHAESFAISGEPIVGAHTPIHGQHKAEGPSLVRWQGEWLLYWDSYTAGHYSVASSPDLVDWTDESARLRMPTTHPRHGTVFIANRENVAWPLVEAQE